MPAIVASDADVAADTAPLFALVLAVEGRAEVSSVPADVEPGAEPEPLTWTAIERGAELPAGATIRTGARSSVTLRVGLNATVRVNSLARARVGELVRTSGEAPTLRTTVVLERGDLDVRVDHIEGAANDFAVVTQTATLAVRGTNFSVGVDGLDGLRVQGAETNSFRAIEVQYLEDEKSVGLSKGKLAGGWKNPALAALASTVDAPNQGVGATDYLSRIGVVVTQLASGPSPNAQMSGLRDANVRTISADQVKDAIASGDDGPKPQGESIGSGPKPRR